MKKLHLLALGVVIMFGFAGCEKPTVVNQAAADVFIKSIKNPLDTSKIVYAAIHSVFSYNLMTSVSVTSPVGETMQLTDFDKTGNSFYNQPADTTFKPTIPTIGVYSYQVTFKGGEQQAYTNTLLTSSLEPAVITSLEKNAHGDSVYLKWNAIPNVDFYQVKVVFGTTVVYYADKLTDTSSPKKANLKLGFTTNSITTGVSGTYIFELTGLLYESTAYDYLQAISSAKKNIAL